LGGDSPPFWKKKKGGGALEVIKVQRISEALTRRRTKLNLRNVTDEGGYNLGKVYL